ncbi:LysE family translocator [Aestuariirhabdus sp. Z084]|uniref:LysE family translocator n=1 Tax=Aestuariirhabdus haliotis TaxID=2918751 RepID=UPI00201B3B6B|nr:LysE family translocator [Aestuariirhabdus haliotis]MCL6415704.1 LysE family translocator [Aestuariirhabdus haliotis]MCL6419770.1 LysE family translocator [Aestuariirhabdus haliotis]
MDYLQVISFAIIALLLVISPGPNGLLIAKTVPSAGKQAGFANVAGFLAAFYLHGSLSILGISVILTQSAEAFFVVKLLGAAYLTWIGLKALLSATRPSPKPQTNAIPGRSKAKLSRSFLEGFLTNALNPKVSMFYLAAFPQFMPIGDNAISYAFLLVTVHSLINLLWFSSMVLLFSRLVSASKNPVFQRVLQGVTGVVFIGFGAKLMALQPK